MFSSGSSMFRSPKVKAQMSIALSTAGAGSVERLASDDVVGLAVGRKAVLEAGDSTGCPLCLIVAKAPGFPGAPFRLSHGQPYVQIFSFSARIVSTLALSPAPSKPRHLSCQPSIGHLPGQISMLPYPRHKPHGGPGRCKSGWLQLERRVWRLGCCRVFGFRVWRLGFCRVFGFGAPVKKD